MKRTITVILSQIVFTFLLVQSASASEWEAMPSATFKIPQPVVKKVDTRVSKLKNYLEKHQSPLAPFARDFVKKADDYGLPHWSIVPAITGVESTFGKKIPTRSYNAYGWANGRYYFTSWEESIDVVTKTLKQKYYTRGANSIEKIAPIYAPPSKTWAGKVRFFMHQIEDSPTFDPHDLPLNL